MQNQPKALLNLGPMDFLTWESLELKKFLQIIKYMSNKQTSLSTGDLVPLAELLTLSRKELLKLLYFGSLIECLEESEAGIISLTPLGQVVANFTGKKGETTPLVRILVAREILFPNLEQHTLRERYCMKLLQQLCSGFLLDHKLNIKHAANRSSVFVPDQHRNLTQINPSLLSEELGMSADGNLLNIGCIWNSQIEIRSTVIHLFDLYKETAKLDIVVAIKRVFDHFFNHQPEYRAVITEGMSLLVSGITKELLIEVVPSNHPLNADELSNHSNRVLISYEIDSEAEGVLQVRNLRFIPALNLFEFYHNYRIQLEQIKDHFTLKRFRVTAGLLIRTFFEGSERIWTSTLCKEMMKIGSQEQKRGLVDISVQRVEHWIYSVLPVLPRINSNEVKKRLKKLESSLFDPVWKIKDDFLVALRTFANTRIGTERFGDMDYYLVNLISPIIAESKGLTGFGAQLFLLDNPEPYIILVYRGIIHAGSSSVEVLSLKDKIENSMKFGNKSIGVLETALASCGKFPRTGFVVTSEIEDPTNPLELLSPHEINDPFLQAYLRKLRINLTHPHHSLISAVSRDTPTASIPPNVTNILIPLDIESIEGTSAFYRGWLLFTSEGILGNLNAPFTFHPDIAFHLYLNVVLTYFNTILSQIHTEINTVRFKVEQYHQVAWRLLYETSSGKEGAQEALKEVLIQRRGLRRRKDQSPQTISEILAALNQQVRPKLQDIQDSLNYSSLDENLSFIEERFNKLHLLTVFSENNQFPSFTMYNDCRNRLATLYDLQKKAKSDVLLIENQIATLAEVIELYLNDRSKRLLEWLAYLSIVSVLGEVVATSFLFTIFQQVQPVLALLTSLFIVSLALSLIAVILVFKFKTRA
ncbi:MAG: hypothetical protein ACFFBD_17440 [Candidatus Hodarchaeota archaeon]